MTVVGVHKTTYFINLVLGISEFFVINHLTKCLIFCVSCHFLQAVKYPKNSYIFVQDVLGKKINNPLVQQYKQRCDRTIVLCDIEYIIYILFDLFLCSIAVYFYEFLCTLASPYKQPVKNIQQYYNYKFTPITSPT